MKNMKKLRILYINDGSLKNFFLPPSSIDSKYIPNGSIECLSNNLRWIFRKQYPWESLTENFEPQRLVHLYLGWSLLHDLWTKRKELLPCVRWLDLSFSRRLMQTPNFTGMPNLECLNLEKCSSLKEHQAYLTKLDLSVMEKLVALPSSIGMLKGLVKLDVSWCPKLNNLPEEIGNLENLEELDASCTRISQPPSSIVRLNKLKSLSFSGQCLKDGVYFVFPQVNEQLHSLEILNLSFYNLIDGGVPKDIGCLSSLKELHLNGNNFVHLPESISQLGGLETLYLSNCKRLPQLPEFSKQLHTISANWSNDLICNSLFHNISFDSDSLSLRALMSRGINILGWFHHQGTSTNVSVNLPKNWYVRENFLGFVVCYSGN